MHLGVIIVASLAFWFALDALKSRKGGWWAEAHYLAHTAAISLLAAILTIQVWTDGIGNPWTMVILTFFMFRGLWESWQDERREREARHMNAKMIAAFRRQRERNPDFMKGFEPTEDGLEYRVRTNDGPEHD